MFINQILILTEIYPLIIEKKLFFLFINLSRHLFNVDHLVPLCDLS